MTIYGYIRVSTEDQIDNTSLETQKSMIEGVAKANQLPDNKIVWLEDVASLASSLSWNGQPLRRKCFATVM